MVENMKVGGRRLRAGEVIEANLTQGRRKGLYRLRGFDPEAGVAEVYGPIGRPGEGLRFLPLDRIGRRVKR